MRGSRARMTDSGRYRLTSQGLLRRSGEPLWVAALGVHFIVLGKLLVPAMIHLVGRGGQTETVEWAIYMLLLVGYAPLVWFFAKVLPRRVSHATTSAVWLAIVVVSAFEFAYYAVTASWLFLLTATLATAATTVLLDVARRRHEITRSDTRWDLSTTVPLFIAGLFGWMSAGGLVSWGDAVKWLAASAWTAIALVAATVLTVFALTPPRDESADDDPRLRWLRWWDYPAIAALAIFSFRTFPVVEFYHWGFYVGPIEQLRQGGRLLWDTPSQYGFLSIVIPTILPGRAWASFWFFQSAIFAIVAALMYQAFRRLGSRWINALFAFAITFSTLFFRPRSESLILPAQMTPSGGPVRFLWCFVLVAFITGYFFRLPEKQSARGFAIGGTAIWLASLLWSAEGAIYCSAIWFSSYAVFLAEQMVDWRKTAASPREAWRRLVKGVAVPVVGLVAVVLLVTLIYLALFATLPDWRGYLEYVLLYSRGGFGALPVDPTGSVWYLMLLFLGISTILFWVAADVHDPRLVVLAGVWGGAWSVGSYFVGRSHPVNALSLAPFLLFCVAISLRMIGADRSTRWYAMIVTAMVPAFAIPITLTLGHTGFPVAVTQRQLPPARFTDQLPRMEPALLSLLSDAGAQPGDSYVRVGDGRLMLPAWTTADGRGAVTSDRSWLPKPYEIIGSLPAGRRQVYIDRNAKRNPTDGWLIHSKRDTIRGYAALLKQIERTRHEEKQFENLDWIVSWMAIGPPRGASATDSTAFRTSSPPRPRTNQDSARR